MESACETCSYFTTGPEFVPVLSRQRDHARHHNRHDRAAPRPIIDEPKPPLDTDYPCNGSSVLGDDNGASD